MTPFGESHRYQEQIGAFLLGKLDAGELEAMRAHLDGCSVCQAEVKELEPVVAGLADAVPDRIDEVTRPPGDLEESTLAPILGEIQRARSSRQQVQWSALAAAAIFVVLIGLAGLLPWLVEPAVAMEPLSFSVAPGVKVEGHLIAHDWGTEIRLVVVSGLRDGQTYRVTLVSEDGERVNAGTFIGAKDEPVRGTFNAALSREDAARLEVRAPGGERVFIAELPEEPRDPVREWPLLGVLPWAGPGLQNDTMGPSGPEGPEGPTQEKPKDAGPGGGILPEGSSPEGDGGKSPPGDEKPGPAPEESEPPNIPPPSSPPPSSPPPSSPSPVEPDPCEVPPNERPPTCDQYEQRL